MSIGRFFHVASFAGSLIIAVGMEIASTIDVLHKPPNWGGLAAGAFWALFAIAIKPQSANAVNSQTSETVEDKRQHKGESHLSETGPGTLTDDIYRASLPPLVQNALKLEPEKRYAKLLSLAAQGFLIDFPIMDWGWDAQKTMEMRQSFGYTWVPSAMMPPIEVAPHVNFYLPGAPPYDPNTIPPGAIKVSTDAADYPAWGTK